MKPKVSIVVPIYKVEPYLTQCVESLLGQTLREIEIILVDDGSPDGCPALCDRFAAGDRRVRVLHQANAGPSAARNRGLELASADWVMFTDGDDWLEPNAAEVLYEEAVRRNCGLVCASFWRSGPDWQEAVRISPSDAGEYRTAESLEMLLGCVLRYRRIHVPLRTAWGKIYRKSLAAQCRFPEGLRKYEDGLFNLCAVRQAEKLCVLDRPLYHYRIRPQSGSRTFFEDELALCRLYWAETRAFLDRFRLWEELRAAYHYTVVYTILKMAETCGMQAAGRDLEEAVRLLMQFCAEPDCRLAIRESRIWAMPDGKSLAGLCLLKLRWYRAIAQLCALRRGR